MKRISVVLSIVACLVACDNKPAATGPAPSTNASNPKEQPKEQPKEAAFEYSEWNAWNGFGKGSSVTFYMKMEANNMEMWQTHTIKEKTDSEITLVTTGKTKMKIGDNVTENETPASERKVTKATTGEAPKECAACKKPVADHKKPDIKDGAGKVGDKEVKTKEMTMFGCDGKEVAKMVLSTDVPGWAIEMGAAPNIMKATAFEKK